MNAEPVELDEVTPLHIALDYDGTYSADPAMWNKFIKIAQAHGHKVTCVTMRKATLTERLDMEIDVIYTNRKGKVAHCGTRRRGDRQLD